MKLFEPGNIGVMQVKNRIVMAPMGVGAMAEADGNWTERVREFYIARARGGVGLITTGIACVSMKLEPIAKIHLNLYSDSHLDSLCRIVEGVHEYGTKLSVQLTAGFGRVVAVRWQKPSIPPISASATPCYFNPATVARALSTEEVQELTQAFGAAAKRCQMAGVDAVELHGHEGYLMDQFMSGIWNQRTDKYGGSSQKRLTFAKEAIAAIKREVGQDFPVIYRYAIDHYLEGGRTPDESAWIAEQLEPMRVDALHVDAGCYETSWWPHPPTYQPPGCMLDMAEKVKPVVGIPVIAVGNLHYPRLAEKALQEGKTDFIAVGRGLLADPDWANKVMENRFDDIRPCIGDHEGCFHRLHSGKSTSCTVNPACGYEKELVLTPIKGKKKTLLVVGGGPAGMEAAHVAALRGIEVILWEKTGRLGGNLWPASAPGFKRELKDLLQYQVNQLQKLPVKIELGKEGTAENILQSGVEAVILATGAVPQEPNIVGISNDNTITAVDLLLKKGKVGKSVLVVGGGLIGCETAVYLAQNGCRVTVIEQLPDVLTDMFFVNRGMLLKMMTDNNVQVLTSALPMRVVDGGVLVKHNNEDRIVPAKSIVIAVGMSPCNDLEKILNGKVAELYTIGDCAEPGGIIDAIWQAFHTARKIDA